MITISLILICGGLGWVIGGGSWLGFLAGSFIGLAIHAFDPRPWIDEREEQDQ